MARVSNDKIESIAGEIMKPATDIINKIHDEITKIVIEDIESKYSSEFNGLTDEFKNKWLTKINSKYTHVEGLGHRWFYFKKEVFYSRANESLNIVGVTAERLVKTINKFEQEKKKRETKPNTVKATLRSLNTEAKILKEFPELSKYFVKAEVTTAVALPMQEVKNLIRESLL